MLCQCFRCVLLNKVIRSNYTCVTEHQFDCKMSATMARMPCSHCTTFRVGDALGRSHQATLWLWSGVLVVDTSSLVGDGRQSHSLRHETWPTAVSQDIPSTTTKILEEWTAIPVWDHLILLAIDGWIRRLSHHLHQSCVLPVHFSPALVQQGQDNRVSQRQMGNAREISPTASAK